MYTTDSFPLIRSKSIQISRNRTTEQEVRPKSIVLNLAQMYDVMAVDHQNKLESSNPKKKPILLSKAIKHPSATGKKKVSELIANFNKANTSEENVSQKLHQPNPLQHKFSENLEKNPFSKSIKAFNTVQPSQEYISQKSTSPQKNHTNILISSNRINQSQTNVTQNERPQKRVQCKSLEKLQKNVLGANSYSPKIDSSLSYVKITASELSTKSRKIPSEQTTFSSTTHNQVQNFCKPSSSSNDKTISRSPISSQSKPKFFEQSGTSNRVNNKTDIIFYNKTSKKKSTDTNNTCKNLNQSCDKKTNNISSSISFKTETRLNDAKDHRFLVKNEKIFRSQSDSTTTSSNLNTSENILDTNDNDESNRIIKVKSMVSLFEKNSIPSQEDNRKQPKKSSFNSIPKQMSYDDHTKLVRSENSEKSELTKNLKEVLQSGNIMEDKKTNTRPYDEIASNTSHNMSEMKLSLTSKQINLAENSTSPELPMKSIRNMIKSLEKNSKDKCVPPIPPNSKSLGMESDKKSSTGTDKLQEQQLVCENTSENSFENQPTISSQNTEWSPQETYVRIENDFYDSLNSFPSGDKAYANPNNMLQINVTEENIYEYISPSNISKPIGTKSNTYEDIFGEVNYGEQENVISMVTMADNAAAEKASFVDYGTSNYWSDERWSFTSEGPICEIEATNSSLSKLYGVSFSCESEENVYDEPKPCVIEEVTSARNEPLYQIYISSTTKENFPEYKDSESAIYEDIDRETDRQEQKEIQVRPMPNDIIQQNKGSRLLWCYIPEVEIKKLTDKLSAKERKLQEIKFEIMTSEATYINTIQILISHFMESTSLNNVEVISREDKATLFNNILSVKRCSENFLKDIENCWKDDIFLENMCEIIYQHAVSNLEPYIIYCSNQVYQETKWKQLMKSTKFSKAVSTLQNQPVCQKQNLHSFLILPMQRITRMRLLVDSIVGLHETDDPRYRRWKEALSSLNDVVDKCNEGVRRSEKIQEVEELRQQFDFRNVEAFSLMTGNRWLEKKGELFHLQLPNISGAHGNTSSPKIRFSKSCKIIKQPMCIFLFTDLLVITRKQSEEKFLVLDYCARNLVEVIPAEVDELEFLMQKLTLEDQKKFFTISMLQNSEKRTVHMTFMASGEDEKKIWQAVLAQKRLHGSCEIIYEECSNPDINSASFFSSKPTEMQSDIPHPRNTKENMQNNECNHMQSNKDNRRPPISYEEIRSKLTQMKHQSEEDTTDGASKNKKHQKTEKVKIQSSVERKERNKKKSSRRSYGSTFKKSVSLFSNSMSQIGFHSPV